MYKFFVKHSLLVKIVASLLTCSFCNFCLIMDNASWWSFILWNLIYIFLTVLVLESFKLKRIDKANKDLINNCNPYPLYEESKFLLENTKSEAKRQTQTLNYACALHYIGEFQQVYDILSNINIDKNTGTLPIEKIIYYNNLAGACFVSDKIQEGEIWLNKAWSLLEIVKNKKQKSVVFKNLTMNSIECMILKKDFSTAIEKLDNLVPENNLQRVYLAMMFAKAHIGLGDIDKAKYDLDFVMHNSNKLYLANEAKGLLNNLNT